MAAATAAAPASTEGNTRLERLLAPLCVSVFVGCILASALLSAAALAALLWWPRSAWSWTLAALVAALAAAPLGPPPAWAAAAIAFASRAAVGYFPVALTFEDAAALRADKAYVIALEPHSALPTAIPAAFGARSALLPPALAGRSHGLVSSACFRFPLVRHLYYWWGFRPVTRRAMARVLRSGRAAVVVPGGVRECLEMDATGRSEVALLRRRTGFIRLAMQCGADVVPAFAFGQTATYRWLLPGPPLVPRRLVRALARRVGFAPMLLLGRGGSPAPLRSKLTVVVGKPLGLPACEAPTDAEVRAWLEAFIKELAALFERHKAAAGHPELMLRVL